MTLIEISYLVTKVVEFYGGKHKECEWEDAAEARRALALLGIWAKRAKDFSESVKDEGKDRPK